MGTRTSGVAIPFATLAEQSAGSAFCSARVRMRSSVGGGAGETGGAGDVGGTGSAGVVEHPAVMSRRPSRKAARV
jgi:hypothetical protein